MAVHGHHRTPSYLPGIDEALAEYIANGGGETQPPDLSGSSTPEKVRTIAEVAISLEAIRTSDSVAPSRALRRRESVQFSIKGDALFVSGSRAKYATFLHHFIFAGDEHLKGLIFRYVDFSERESVPNMQKCFEKWQELKEISFLSCRDVEAAIDCLLTLPNLSEIKISGYPVKGVHRFCPGEEEQIKDEYTCGGTERAILQLPEKFQPFARKGVIITVSEEKALPDDSA
jgi:hypothetical protein